MKKCKICKKTIVKNKKSSYKQFDLQILCSKLCSDLHKKGKKTGVSSWNKGLSSWVKGRHLSDKHKNGISKGNLGKKRTNEVRVKLSQLKRGTKHPNWRNGLSLSKYTMDFNKDLKFKIRKRDNFRCMKCNKSEEEERNELGRVLCVNHIDFIKENCSEENLNTLCAKCNSEINYNRDYWTLLFKKQIENLCKYQKKS